MEAAANYQPASELIHEEDYDTLVLDLTGFKKDQLKVQLTRESRTLKISGVRQLEDKRWISFHKDFPVSPNCDTQKIRARFDKGMLFITMPKLISPAEKEGSKKLPSLETQKPQKPAEEKFDANGERASRKNLPSDYQNKQTIAKNVADKPLEKDETESSNAKSQEQVREKTFASDDQDEHNSAKNVPEESLFEKEETEFSTDDQNAKSSLSKKGDEFSSNGKGQNMSSWARDNANAYAETACGPAAKLKMARQKMKMGLSVLLAFLLIGLYVSNLVWYSKKAENFN